MSRDIARDDAFREAVVDWLRVNGIDARDIPPDPKATLVGDQLTLLVFLLDENGNRLWDFGDKLRTETRTVTITEQPTPYVSEWLRPRCPECGR